MCGSSEACDPKFLNMAYALGENLGEFKHDIIYGGGAKGLMRQVADGALAAGTKVHGYMPKFMIAVEVSDTKHPIAQELISQVGHGLAAPSANKFTKTSPTSKEHVLSEFGEEVFVQPVRHTQFFFKSESDRIHRCAYELYRLWYCNSRCFRIGKIFTIESDQNDCDIVGSAIFVGFVD